MGKRRRHTRSSSTSSSSSSSSSSDERYRKTTSERSRTPLSGPALYEGRSKSRRYTSKSVSSMTRQLRKSQHREEGSSSQGLVHVPNNRDEARIENQGAQDAEVGVTSQWDKSAYENRIARLENIIEDMSKQSAGAEQRLVVRSDCIPEFHPENENLPAVTWLEKIEQLKNINGWNDITTIYHMQSRLAGMAKTWYHSLPSVNYTWTEWKCLINKTFPDHIDFAKVLRKMLDRHKQPNESMTAYYFGKMELMRTCQITQKCSIC